MKSTPVSAARRRPQWGNGLPHSQTLPGGKFFLAEYAKQGYKEPPEAYGAFAFTAMNLILDTIEAVGKVLEEALDELEGLDTDQLLQARYDRSRALGAFEEG